MGNFNPPVEKVMYKAMCLGFPSGKFYANSRPLEGEIVDVFEEIGKDYLSIVNHGILHRQFFRRVTFSMYTDKL